MIPIDLTGKRALVTGGAQGLGRACALTLAEAGARVGVVDINLAGAEETAAQCPNGLAWACDLADPVAIEALAPRVEAELGDLDILINNAGIVAYAQHHSATRRHGELRRREITCDQTELGERHGRGRAQRGLLISVSRSSRATLSRTPLTKAPDLSSLNSLARSTASLMTT